jgi:hypothetical protein
LQVVRQVCCEVCGAVSNMQLFDLMQNVLGSCFDWKIA